MSNLSDRSLVDRLTKEFKNLPDDVYSLMLVDAKITDILDREDLSIVLALESKLDYKYLNTESNYLKVKKFATLFYYICYGVCSFIAFYLCTDLPNYIQALILKIGRAHV